MPNRVKQALDILKTALENSRRNGWDERVARIQKARADLAKPAPVAKPEPKPVTVYPAIRAARLQSANGPAFAVGTCLKQVRGCYLIPALFPSAAAAWNGAKVKHRETNPRHIPRGYPVFWTGGSHGFGHIAISTGDGNCWSTDIDRPGFFDYAPIDLIHEKWGLTLVGWSEDLNGHPVVAKEIK